MRRPGFVSILLLALGPLACATAPPPPVAPGPAAPPPAEQIVDYRPVFGGRASSSIYDPRLAAPQLMARVLLEPSAFAEDDAAKGMEAWTLRKLLHALGQRGATVIAPPPPACDPPRCYAASPTAALRNLRFVSGRDGLPARVLRRDDRYTVLLRFRADEPSLCGPDFKLRVRVVQLIGQAQTLPEGAIAAVFQELVVVEPPSEPTLKVTVPDPDTAADVFCAAIAQAYEDTPGFASDDARFEHAADELLDTMLAPLFPAQPGPSTPPAPPGAPPAKPGKPAGK